MWAFLSVRLRRWLLMATALPLARLLVHRLAVAADRYDVRSAGDLAAKDRDLVPQDQDLHLLGGAAAREQYQPAEHSDHEQIEDANEHDRRG